MPWTGILPGHPVVLPVGRKKDGSLKAGSHAVGQEEFGELSAFVHHKIAELGTDILAGNIDALPYRLDKKGSLRVLSIPWSVRIR